MTTPTRVGKTGLPVLRPGKLREQVLAVLTGDPTRAWSVGEISRALGDRSTGAVQGRAQAAHRTRPRRHRTHRPAPPLARGSPHP